MSWDESTTDRDTPGKPRRAAEHFDTATRSGPCESRRDGDDWLAREWGDTTWRRWRKVHGTKLWERVE